MSRVGCRASNFTLVLSLTESLLRSPGKRTCFMRAVRWSDLLIMKPPCDILVLLIELISHQSLAWSYMFLSIKPPSRIHPQYHPTAASRNFILLPSPHAHITSPLHPDEYDLDPLFHTYTLHTIATSTMAFVVNFYNLEARSSGTGFEITSTSWG